MGLVKWQFSRHNCYLSSPDFSFKGKSQGFTFKSPCLTMPKARQKPFPLSKHSLYIYGYDSRKKGVNVATPNTPLTRTVELLDAYDVELLDAYEDEYDGAIIYPECLPASTNAFAAILQYSLSLWKLKGKKGIWLKILEEQADLVPIAIKEGFTYHHAEPGYVVLTYWIPNGPCLLPSTGTHQIGIGGFVINENREVLVVKEMKCPLRCSGVWKLPTGFIDKSEEIFSGAIREVKEETGIDTTFSEVVAFRHAHHVAFEKSDLFFVCMLKPLSFDITIDESEIQAAKWMPLDEFINQPFYREDRMSKNMIDICVARYENHYKGFTAHQLMSKFDDRLSYFYHGDLTESTNESPPNVWKTC